MRDFMIIKNVRRIVNRHQIKNFAMLCLAGIFGFFGAWIFNTTNPPIMPKSEDARMQIVSNESELNALIASNVSPSVVSINVEKSVSNFFFGDYNSQSSGTGIILSEDGYIVTNKHVIPQGTKDVSVTLSDGTVYDEVKVIGRDPRSSVDIAFLKIEGVKGLKPAKLADSSKVRVGEKVVAIGNALGQFQNTVTTGVISGLGRPITAGDGSSSENLSNLFQTDSAINPGNSGGPLVNINSEVIGINTAIAGNAQNIGFAIPVNDVKGLIAGVLGSGKLEVPYLGVRYVNLTPEIAKEFDLERDKGAYIYSSANQRAVALNSPAEKAGIKKGDIIMRVNDVEIDSANNLAAVLGRFKVGEGVSLKILRDGKEQVILATLESAPIN